MTEVQVPIQDKAARKAEKKALKKSGDTPPKSKKKLLIVVLVGGLLIAAGGWFFVLAPASATSAPKPGAVVALEPIQVNLAGGHYLKLGLALQITADTKTPPDGSKALDTAIALFSGRSMAELVRPGQRARLKKRLTKNLKHRYDGEVMAVYFTDFVTQ
jgi:flagellar FliL protein